MAPKFRRGFKAQVERFSKEYRLELGLQLHDPLCPWKLANHFQIPVKPISALKEITPEAVTYLMGKGRDEFSAITLCEDQPILIINNDAHSRHRQASDIAHELGHIILKHTSMPPLNDIKCRIIDKQHEEEANWLGPALLISQEAAIHILRNNMELDEASNIYGSSKEVIKMRLNVSGARRIWARSNH
jgi:hypothetical protein